MQLASSNFETVFGQMFGKDTTMTDLSRFIPEGKKLRVLPMRKPVVKRLVLDGELQEFAGLDHADLNYTISVNERRRNAARITAEHNYNCCSFNSNPFIPGTITHRAYDVRMNELRFPDVEIF